MPRKLVDTFLHVFLINWVLFGVMSKVEDLCGFNIFAQPHTEVMIVQLRQLGFILILQQHLDQVKVILLLASGPSDEF